MSRHFDSPEVSQQPVRRRHLIVMCGAVLLAYVAAAYALIPAGWHFYTKLHPTFDADPRLTRTSDGHPGDPLNVAIVGTADDLKQAMQAAGWYPAAALGMKSDLRIVTDTLLSRPDETAPVSRLYLYGRKEDLAFEKPVGHSPRQRNHVRFWRREMDAPDGRSVWMGSATFDKGVGFSHATGEVTHHIDGQIDVERDRFIADLQGTGWLIESYRVPDFHTVLHGKNGGGDRWTTDGDLAVGILQPLAVPFPSTH